MKKRLLASLMSLCLIVGLLPTAAFAAEPDTTEAAPQAGVCEVTPGCTLEAGHEGDCVVAPAEGNSSEQENSTDTQPGGEDISDPAAPVCAELAGCVDGSHDPECPLYVAPVEPEEVPTPVEPTEENIILDPAPVVENGEMSGNCGAEGNESNVTWALTKNEDESTYTLTISGSGAMADYGRYINGGNNFAPWANETYAEAITKVVIGEGVTTIGTYAFSSMTAITEVSLPSTLTSIGDWAFMTCKSLVSVTIPASVTTIGENPFRECSSLGKIELAEGSSFSAYSDGIALISIDGTQLISYPAAYISTSYTIPETVTTLQDGAFGAAKLDNITIGDNVTSIGEWCFASSSLTSVTIPSTVTTWGQQTFRGCTSLERAEIGTTTIPDYTFYGDKSLTDVTFAEGTTSIGKNAFYEAGLTEITLPAAVENLGDLAFANAENLKKVIFSGKVSTLGYQPFMNSGLEIVIFSESGPCMNGNSFAGCNSLKVIDTSAYSGTIGINDNTASINLPYGCMSGIPSGTIFYSQSTVSRRNGGSADNVVWAVTNGATISKEAIEKSGNTFAAVTVEEGYRFDGWADADGEIVTSGTAGQEYFASYYALSGTDGGINWKFSPDAGVLTISPASGKENTGKMSNYTMSTYTSAPWFAFRNSLEKIIFETGVTSIGNYSFYGYKNLKEVTINGNLDSSSGVNNNCFNASEVKLVKFGNSKELYIPNDFLAGCNSLRMIDLTAYTGESLKFNGDNGGYQCFKDVPESAVICVNNSLKSLTNYAAVQKLVWAVTGAGISLSANASKTGVDAVIKDGYFVTWNEAGSITANLGEGGSLKYAAWTASSYAVPDSVSFDALTYGDTPVPQMITVTGGESPSVTNATGSDSFTASADGATVTITPKANLPVGTYEETIVVTTGDGATHNVTVTLTVQKADSTVTPGEDAGDIKATYGETITFVADVAKAENNIIAPIANSAEQDEVSFYCGENLLGTAVVVYSDEAHTVGTAKLEYDTSKNGIPTVSEQTVTAVYGGSINLNGSNADSIKVTLSKAQPTVDISASSTSLSGGGTVTLTVNKSGLPDDATVSVTCDDTTYNPTDNGNGTYTVSLPNSTDTYTFTVSYDGNEWYNAASDTCTVSVTRTGGSGGGGGSSSGSTGNITGSGDDVNIDVSGGTVTAAQMEKAVDKADRGETITIEASSRSSVSLPSSGLQDAADNNNDVTVELKNGEVTLSPEALSAVAEQAGTTVTLTVDPVDTDELNSRQQAAVGDAPVFDLTLKSGGKTITDFDGGLVTVAIPYELPDGQDPSGVVVWFMDDNGNITACETMYDLRTETVIFTTRHFSKYVIGYEEPMNFTDVPADAYYADAVKWAVAEGITNGTSDTTFGPDVSCTRAQMVTFLWRQAGAPKSTGNNPFTDVQAGSYYYDAVLWAVEQGITSGTSATTFAPDAVCTRAQTVTFLWRQAGTPVVNYAMSFADVDASAYYGEAVRWAVSEGITSGTSATTFSPNVDCTRAQIVTFMYRAEQ